MYQTVLLNYKNEKYKFQIFKFLNLKKQEIVLETTFYFFYKFHFNFYLTNILNNLNICNFLTFHQNKLFLNKKYNKRLKKHILFYYLFFTMSNSKLISQYFGYVLLRTKFHMKNIRFCLQTILKLYLNKTINFKGFKLFISGKLNGKMRKQKYLYKTGKFILNTFSSKINFNYLPLYTKYGIFSIKI